MSLLLEALKRAEKAKEEAQRRARDGENTGELRLADEAAPAAEAEKRVVTRDELPPITAPLEIQSEDLRAEAARAPAGGLALEEPAFTKPPRGAAQPQAAPRATARKVFEAKVREPNPRLPFYITMGALGAFAVGTAIYFYIQLRPPPPLYNTNPQPPAGEVAVAPAPLPTPPPAASAPSGSIPGLPPVAQAPREPSSAPATQAPAPPRSLAPAEAKRPAVRPAAPPPSAPRAEAARARPVQPAAERIARPAPRVHPLVAAGYAAYQAGDMERARVAYQGAVRDEPANRDALLGLAAVESRALRFEAAATLYRRVLLADPRDPHAHAGLLALRAPQPDALAAESRLKGLLAGDPEEGVLHFALGNQYAQQARWAEARQAYARAAALEPENPDYAYNLAVSHEHLRQSEAALPLYRKALALALQRTASFDPAAAQARIEALSR